MSLVKILDFCSALKVKEGTVRSKISRGQIVCNEKRLIDTENPINYKYIIEINGGDQTVFEKHCIANVEKKVSPTTKTKTKVLVSEKTVPKTVKKSPEKPKKEVLEKPSKIKGSVTKLHRPETKKTPPKKVVVKETKLSAQEKFEKDLAKQQMQIMLEIDIAKKKADLDLVQRNAEVRRMQLEKIMGNTLPLDQVMSIMAINFKAVFKSLHSQIKNMTSTMVQNLGGTKDDYNAIMIEMEEHLNNSVKMSKEKAQMDIDALIEEYSEIRSRGEKKA